MIGRVRAALGWATADRREEAKGRLEQLDAEPETSTPEGAPAQQPDGTGGVDDEQVLDEAELAVRGDHGDLTPSAEEQVRPTETPPTLG
jgi:hypothetical protein